MHHDVELDADAASRSIRRMANVLLLRDRGPGQRAAGQRPRAAVVRPVVVKAGGEERDGTFGLEHLQKAGSIPTR